MHEEAKVNISSNVLVGIGSEECNRCKSGLELGCHMNPSSQSYSAFGPQYGLVSSTFALGFSDLPEKKPWDKVMGYQLIHGLTHVDSNIFINYNGVDACGHEQYSFANHPKAPDAFHPHIFSNTTWENVSKAGKMMLYGADPSWRNPSDCGTDVFDCSHPMISKSTFCVNGKSVNVSLNCQGPAHVVLTDADGSFGEGKKSFYLGHHETEERPTFHQGTISENPTCRPNLESGAYQCETEANKNQEPPQMFVIESRDPDTETRNFSPLLLGQEGTNASKNLLVTTMDHGWCAGYTCQKRLSTFWTYVETGFDYSLDFTGTPSKMMRFWFPYAKKESEIILKIAYASAGRRFSFVKSASPSRIQPLKMDSCTLRNGNFVSEEVMKSCLPQRGDGNPHGSYYYHQSTNTMYVKVKGGEPLEVRTEDVVSVSAKLAMSFEDFYEDMYIQNMAKLLNIDPKRIKIVSVVPGSVVIDLIITEDPEVLEKSGLYGDIPDKEFNTAAFEDPEVPANATTSESEDQEAEETAETDAPSEGNDVMNQLESLQSESSQKIQDLLKQVAANGSLEASLSEVFPGATYQTLAVTTTASTDDENEGAAQKIVVGPVVPKGQGKTKDIPTWLMATVVAAACLALIGIGLIFYLRRKSKRSRSLSPVEDEDEERGNMKKVQKTHVPKKAPPPKKESFKKFFSKKLFSPKGDSQKNTGPDQVRLFGRSPLGAAGKTSADLSGHQDSQPNTGQLPALVLPPHMEENPTFAEAVQINEVEVRLRSTSLRSISSVDASVKAALDSLEKDMTVRALVEREEEWRRDQSGGAVDESVRQALADVEQERVYAPWHPDAEGAALSRERVIEGGEDALRADTLLTKAMDESVSQAMAQLKEDRSGPVAVRSGSDTARGALGARAETEEKMEAALSNALAELSQEGGGGGNSLERQRTIDQQEIIERHAFDDSSRALNDLLNSKFSKWNGSSLFRLRTTVKYIHLFFCLCFELCLPEFPLPFQRFT